MREPSAVIIFVKHGSFLFAGPTWLLFTQWSHFFLCGVELISLYFKNYLCLSRVCPPSEQYFVFEGAAEGKPTSLLTWSSLLNTIFETLPIFPEVCWISRCSADNGLSISLNFCPQTGLKLFTVGKRGAKTPPSFCFFIFLHIERQTSNTLFILEAPSFLCV